MFGSQHGAPHCIVLHIVPDSPRGRAPITLHPGTPHPIALHPGIPHRIALHPGTPHRIALHPGTPHRIALHPGPWAASLLDMLRMPQRVPRFGPGWPPDRESWRQSYFRALACAPPRAQGKGGEGGVGCGLGLPFHSSAVSCRCPTLMLTLNHNPNPVHLRSKLPLHYAQLTHPLPCALLGFHEALGPVLQVRVTLGLGLGSCGCGDKRL